MKKTKLALITASLIASTSALASDNINFANPNSVHSGASIGYDTNGVYLDIQYGNKLTNDWGFLAKYTGEEGFDGHGFRLGLIHDNGLGFKLAYDRESNFGDDDLKSTTTDLSMHYMFGGNQGFALIPEISVGMFKHKEMDNRAYYSNVGINAIYNSSFGLWASVAPQYQYSYSDLKIKDGSRDNFRDWDVTASLGYTFAKNHNIAYQYSYDNSDNLSLIKYSFGF